MQKIYPEEKIKTVEDWINFLSQFPKDATIKAEALALPQGMQLDYAEVYPYHDPPIIKLIHGTYFG